MRVDLSGQRFGKLQVLRLLEKRTKNGQTRWLCQCECGAKSKVRKYDLLLGKTRSCGCLRHACLDISRRRFGRLKAIRPLKNRDNSGQRLWLCQCDCGGSAKVRISDLIRGKTRSCGCLGRAYAVRLGRLTAKKNQKELLSTQTIQQGDQEWYAPRLASAYVNVHRSTIAAWTNPKKGCPWLGNQAIESRRILGPYNLMAVYSLKSDLDRILKEKAKRRPFPEYSGLVHIDAAAVECDVSVGMLRQAYRKSRRRPAREMPAKDRIGRPRLGSYLPREFVDSFKKRHLWNKDADAITVTETAKLLGLSPNSIGPLISKGLLSRKGWAHERRNGHVCRIVLLSRKEVEARQEREHQGDAAAVNESQGRRESARPFPKSDSVQFIPTGFQIEILRALSGRALTADCLESEFHVDRRRLYYGGGQSGHGLKELQEQGLVRNDRRVGGYYNVDSPPEVARKFMPSKEIN